MSKRGHSFGWALEQLDAGQLVQRAGWNGKGMYLYKVPGSTFTLEQARGIVKEVMAFEKVSEIEYLPHIDMKTADGKLVPWLASQTDVQAYDWQTAD